MQASRKQLEAEAGVPLAMERFRPNIVVDGQPAWKEDLWSEVAIVGSEGSVTLKLVKPCSRCTIPDVDPVTGAAPHCVCHLPEIIDHWNAIRFTTWSEPYELVHLKQPQAP
jgi:uncharacterized protein YcbX